jgi:hypothetical protein
MKKWLNPFAFRVTRYGLSYQDFGDIIVSLSMCLLVILLGISFITWSIDGYLLRAIIFITVIMYIPNLIALLTRSED